MASSREAIVLVLDVGSNMTRVAKKETQQSHLDVATECIKSIVSRKIFSESKDELGLVIFGSEKTENPLQEEGYENIRVLRELQLADFDLAKLVENELEASNGVTGDFLSAVIVALDLMKNGSEGKKFGQKTIIMFSNLGGELKEEEHEEIVNGINHMGVEFNIIGPDIPGSDESQHKDTNDAEEAKTDAMVKGEEIIGQILSSVEGESYTLADVMPTLAWYQRRAVNPTAWKCDMRIGADLCIPIQMYIRTREFKLKQSWRRVDPRQRDAPIQMERIYERTTIPDIEETDGDTATTSKKTDAKPEQETEDSANSVQPESNGTQEEETKRELKTPPSPPSTINKGRFELPSADAMQVDKEDLIKGYRFGASLIAFNENDHRNSKLEGDGKCFSVLGFVGREKVPRKYFSGDGAHYAVADPTNEAATKAFSALVHALDEEGTVAIVRYAYNVRSAPRLGALFPQPNLEGLDAMVYIPLPFTEDVRAFLFPPFSDNTKPTDDQLVVMDNLIDTMDLSTAAVDADSGEAKEAVVSTDIMNPNLEHHFHCLNQRALHPQEPLPKPDKKYMAPLEPSSAITDRIKPILENAKRLYKLEVIEKREKRVAAEIFQKSDETVAVAEKVLRLTSDVDDVAKRIGIADPVGDFDRVIYKDRNLFDLAVVRLIEIMWQLIFENLGDAGYEKALECVVGLRDSCIVNGKPNAYNEFVKDLKEGLFNVKRHDFWQKIVEESLGLITNVESAESTVTEDEAKQFLSKDLNNIDDSESVLKEERDLLDELE